MGLGNRVKIDSFIRGVKSEFCDGLDGEATRNIDKGEWFFYRGPVAEGQGDAYSLEVEGVNSRPGLGNPGVALIDGRVTNENRMGLVNEYIWDDNRNNLRFCPMGLVEAKRDIRKGEVLYVGYGPEYDWDGVKVRLVHELGARIVGIWELHGVEEHKEEVGKLVEAMLGWAVEDLVGKRSGSAVERLVMGVIDGRLEKQEMHMIFPGVLRRDGVAEEAGRWIERVLTCKAVVEVSAFRKAGHPEWGPVALKQLQKIISHNVFNSIYHFELTR